MSAPKSVVKVNKNGVTYTSNVDAAKYYIHELSRAALRDVGKYVKKRWREAYYSHFERHSGSGGKATTFQVISSKTTTAPRVEIGLPHSHRGKDVEGFYAYFQEFGTSRQPRLGLLNKLVESNIPQIVEIESKYLSALEDEAKALSLVDEGDYEDDGE